MSERFGKPDIDYRAKRINSEKFGIPPYFTFYCEYHRIAFPNEAAYNDHMALFHPGQEKDTFGDLKPFNEIPVRDFYPIDEREKIDEVITDIHEIQAGLEALDKKLEAKLEGINIPYDCKQYPLLCEAHHCPICGDEHASTTIDKKAIDDNTKYGLTAQQNAIAYTNNENVSVNEIVSNKDKWLSGTMSSMATLVLKQIMKWVLELILIIFWPLRFILKKKAMTKMKKDAESFAKEYGAPLGEFAPTAGPSVTMKSLGDTSDFRCLFHYKTFKETVDLLLEEEQPDMLVYMNLSNINHQQINNMEKMVKLLSTQIDLDYETPGGLKFKDTKGAKVKDELRARQGEGRLDNVQPDEKKGFVKGAVKTGLDSTRAFMERLDFMLDEWYESEEVLCCLIYNLLILTKGENFGGALEIKGKIFGKEHKESVADSLRTLKGVLEVIRTLYMVDWKATGLAELNIIIELVNKTTHQILEALINLLTGKIREGLDGWLHGALKLKGGQVLRRCPPFDDLFLDALPNFVQDLLLKLSNYLKGFWDGFNKVPEGGKGSLDTLRTLLMLTAWIKALEKLISFLDFWAERTEDLAKPSLDDVKEAVSRTKTKGPIFGQPKNLQNLEKSTTIDKTRGLETIKAEKLNNFKEALRQNMEPDRSVPFTSDTVKMLLTNFMGISPETVDKAIEDVDGECRCKNGFRPEEIESLKGLF